MTYKMRVKKMVMSKENNSLTHSFHRTFIEYFWNARPVPAAGMENKNVKMGLGKM